MATHDDNSNSQFALLALWAARRHGVAGERALLLADQRFAHSEKARIVERYRMTKGAKGERVLIAEMTLTDPVFYIKPVTSEKRWAEVPNGHLLPYECNEEAWNIHLEKLAEKRK